MDEAEIFGMPLRGLEKDAQVISAVVIVKMFDAESPTGVSYMTTATDGLTTVEGLGMVQYADVKLRSDMRCEHDKE
jgi:hypothetical protein